VLDAGSLDPGAEAAAQFLCQLRGAYSTANWTAIPRGSGHGFHEHLDTDSMNTWTVK
jgi:hypothetical protein